jgi:YVTN family beta-propeller protein
LFLTACFTTVAAQTSAYVVRQANANEVVVIDTSTNLILATIPSGGEQTAVARAGTIKIVEMHLQNV